MIMKLYMFCMRLSHSGKAFHFAYANQTQESFLDGHVRAFEAFGGVPTRDDPLRQLEAGGDPGRVGPGTVRASPVRGDALPLRLRLVLLPARDRGGAREGWGGGRDRPVPAPPSDPDPARRVAGRAERRAGGRGRPRRRPPDRAPGPRPSGRPPRRELLLLRPLPATPFDVALVLSCRVDAKARICVRQSYYSVPARYAGRRLEVRLGATTDHRPRRRHDGRRACPVAAQVQRGSGAWTTIWRC